MSLDWIADELHRLDANELRRHPRNCEPLPGGRCRVDGALCVNFASNDYLGLANDPRVVAAAVRAAELYGAGAQASALVSGRTPIHAMLETELARFEETEAALLFPSGFAANVGVIGSLVNEGDVVLCDRLNHASLIDGCRLSGARFRVYGHCDLEQLARELDKARDARRRLIVTDSLFSMDGDIAPLRELAELADRTSSMLLVDEAHATGVYGEHGTGLCEAISPLRGLVRIGTLSKAIGSQGGFLAGTRDLIEWVRNTARTQMFSTALTPAACGAALESLQIIRTDTSRRDRVRENSRQLRVRLQASNWSTLGAPDSPIIPIVVGDPQQTVAMSQRLLSQGFFVPAIRPPTVPQGTSRLRISLSALHSIADIDRFCECLSSLGDLKQP